MKLFKEYESIYISKYSRYYLMLRRYMSLMISFHVALDGLGDLFFANSSHEVPAYIQLISIATSAASLFIPLLAYLLSTYLLIRQDSVYQTQNIPFLQFAWQMFGVLLFPNATRDCVWWVVTIYYLLLTIGIVAKILAMVILIIR